VNDLQLALHVRYVVGIRALFGSENVEAGVLRDDEREMCSLWNIANASSKQMCMHSD